MSGNEILIKTKINHMYMNEEDLRSKKSYFSSTESTISASVGGFSREEAKKSGDLPFIKKDSPSSNTSDEDLEEAACSPP